jgi:hypothetical protein
MALMRYSVSTLTAFALLLGMRDGRAKADVIYTVSLNSASAGGPVSAQAIFTAVAGGIEIRVRNTEANTTNAGQAISQIQFAVGGGLGVPTAITSIQGMVTDFVNPPTTQTFPAGAGSHWGSVSSGSTFTLVDVSSPGLTGPGGQPNHLIVAPGSTPNASLTGTHLPSFIGEVDFFLADASVTAGTDLTLANITGVNFSFGTGPEVLLASGTGSTITSQAVPEPASLTLVGVGAVSLLGYRWRRRRSIIRP